MKIIDIKPPVIAILALFISLCFHFIFPKKYFFQWPILGCLAVLVGLIFVVWAWANIRKEGNDLSPKEEPVVFVAGGAYGTGRNPMYGGMVILLIGSAFFVGTLPMLLAPVVFFVIMNLVFIPYEEKVLERVFGQPYVSYKKRTRRWFG